MKDCKHEFRMQPDDRGVVLCYHCNYPLSKEEVGTDSQRGTKNDAGKPDLSLFPREAIEAGSRAFMFGEKKYTRDNWRKGISKERLIAATLRHLFAWKDGELSDPESNLSHLDHAMASLAMLVTLHKE